MSRIRPLAPVASAFPPCTYFRMLVVGYFEGLSSQRAIAWRCSVSLSLRDFLGIPLGDESPDHSSLTRVRNRLPLSVKEYLARLMQEEGVIKEDQKPSDDELRRFDKQQKDK